MELKGDVYTKLRFAEDEASLASGDERYLFLIHGKQNKMKLEVKGNHVKDQSATPAQKMTSDKFKSYIIRNFQYQSSK